MTYIDHAKAEFRAAGWTDDNGKFKDDMQELLCTQVLELLDKFSEHGHSGSSAPYAIEIFTKIAKFEPLVPLSGEDTEWVELNYGDEIKYQNKRCSNVFKGSDNRAYDIDGKIFWEWSSDENGEKFKSYYTSRDSRTYIEFPYTPKKEYVYRGSDSSEEKEDQ
jgi:hypothetical protein